MKRIAKEVGTREGSLGTIEFPEYDSLAEMISLFGDDDVLRLAQRAAHIDQERVARESLKGETPKSVEEAQALVDSWKPGSTRGGKPTLKAMMKKMGEFAAAGRVDEMLQAQQLYMKDGVEAAYAFLAENE